MPEDATNTGTNVAGALLHGRCLCVPRTSTTSPTVYSAADFFGARAERRKRLLLVADIAVLIFFFERERTTVVNGLDGNRCPVRESCGFAKRKSRVQREREDPIIKTRRLT